jgi:hypothetical protein
MTREFQWCVNALALICALAAVPLFAGTKRETLWDRTNIIGLVLLGTALLLHGGLETYLRSSPVDSFNGYVLGWSRSDDGSGWISVYDLGYPPCKEWFMGDVPYRALRIKSRSRNTVPQSIWDSERTLYLRLKYRIRDSKVVTIDAIPVAEQRTSNPRGWRWESREERLRWRLIETLIGGLFFVAGAGGFILKKAWRSTSNSIFPVEVENKP